MQKPSLKTAQEEEIWDYLSAHPEVTYKDVAAACSASNWTRTNYLSHLRKKGLLKFVRQSGRTRYYSVFDSTDIAEFSAAKRATPEALMWQAMRVLVSFTPQDVQVALTGAPIRIGLREIQSYCAMLLRTKYLTVLIKATAEGTPARYRLTKDTGPLPPVEKRMRVVIDGNEDRIVYAGGERL